ncbi:hypothetical protein F4780DRAFT_784647 [Xylariomycetidae sp. FL0641]|nr:hypothetical protein F4780DRAFT_784647 [Xylariomycetidae sp. FL0641]
MAGGNGPMAGNRRPFPMPSKAPFPPGPKAGPVYRYTATAIGASMWFFLMYRAKQDGPVLLGWKHPWDH